MATIKLSTLFGNTQDNIIKAVDSSITTPFHDCADGEYITTNRQGITAGVEYVFENDCTLLETKNFPVHITKLWDKVNNVCSFSEVVDTPIYVARVQLNFEPTVAASGFFEFKAYVNEDTPVFLQAIRTAFKAVDTKMEALFSFYVGSSTGYDIKNKGLFFTYESDKDGEVYNRGILIYKT